MSIYYLQSRGKVSGPMGIEELQKMVRQGRLSRIDRLSADRTSWQSAGEIDWLFPTAAATAVGAVATVTPPAEPSRAITTAVAPVAASVGKSVITIGRDGSCDMVVESLAVGRRHLALISNGRDVHATDLGSGAETYVNGARLKGSQLLQSGDTVSLAGVQFDFDGKTLKRRQAGTGLSIRVRGLGREVADLGTGKPRMLIRDVTMSLLPGEFIALVGSTGAGKSTLFGALSGRVRGTHGQVLYDGQDLYSNFEAFRVNIGYVPQRDVFHDMLPVGEALRTVSRLRLSRDTSPEEIEANIDRVLKIVSLTAKKHSIISTLSGGEQKRVSIAMELHSRPRILFLDEPTAPLDPLTTSQMMELFRGLADSGITVIMITHAANSLSFCDVIAYMHKGLLTFQGSPDRLMSFFGVSNMEDSYKAERLKTPEEWRDRFANSPECQAFVSARWLKATTNVQAGQDEQAKINRRKSAGLGAMLFQTRILTARYLRVVTIDRRNLALTLLLAPLVASLLCLITSDMHAKSDPASQGEWSDFLKKQNVLCFGSVMIVIFLALFGSVREIVKELPIYLREHFVNVEIIPYLLSKLIVLLLIDALQVGMVVAIVNWYGHIRAGEVWMQYGILYLCAAVGTALGLMISALVEQTDHAVTGMIVVVIPQILFSSVFNVLKGIPRAISGSLIAAYWGLNALMHQAMLKAPKDDGTPSYIEPRNSALVLAGQLLVLIGITYWLMERRDGPKAEERIVRKLANALGMPKD